MKVLLSAGMIQGGRSGVGRYVISLADAIVQNHPEVELWIACLEADRTWFPKVPDARCVTIPAACARGPLNLLWHQTALKRHLQQHAIDLVHIPSYRRMLLSSPIPQVATIHDCAPFVLREKYDALRGMFGRVLVPYIARQVDHIITVSETTNRDVQHFMQVPEHRLTTIPNGIDHTMFRPQDPLAVAEFRRRHRLQEPFFLYVARLEHPAKNHLRLIQAFEQLVSQGDFQGQLILPGAPWHGAEVIEAAVNRSPYRDRIRLEGFVDNLDLPLWYAAAEALLFPSLMEGFGLPLLEAQACGTRIACADSTSLPEVSGPAGILFDGLKPEAITAAMRTLATMTPAERAQRESDGIAWAARFTWAAHAADAVKLYHQHAR